MLRIVDSSKNRLRLARVLVLILVWVPALVGCGHMRVSLDRTTPDVKETETVVARSVVATLTAQVPRYQYDRLTYDPAEDFEPALSPDGQTVVFISDRAGLPDVFSIPMRGGQPVNLTQSPSAQEDTPVFSPDGLTIAFASDRDGDWNIYLMDTDGANIRPALDDYTGTDELHPAFTPDGLGLVFSSNQTDGNWDIYTAAIGSSAWTRLTTHPAADRFPNLSADGRTIV
ncbi:MAG: TolB family protein, partial [Dehalococcoidia bacterium]